MSDEPHGNGDPADDGDAPEKQPAAESGPHSEQIQHSQVSALVPERVARGIFSTGAVVLTGAHEFIIDFLQRMTRPHQVAARVVLPPTVVGQLIGALSQNLAGYEQKFGPAVAPGAAGHRPTTTGAVPGGPPHTQLVQPGQPAPPPQPSQSHPQHQQPQQSARDLYDQLKLPEDVLSGVYANAVMIGHSPTEFSFDFITTFFPRSAVACRVYLAAPNARRFLEALKHSYQQWQQQRGRGGPQR